MNKKIIAVLVLLIFFLGCAEKETKEMKDYKIELNAYEFDFEKQKIQLEVYSEKELEKTRFEILGEEKNLKCIDYFYLKKGKNDINFNCPQIEKKVFLEITPSDGTTKEFEIEISGTKKISFKEGFRYNFVYKTPGWNVDYDVFVLDENKEYTKAVVYSSVSDKPVRFSLILIDKSSDEIYSSGAKNSCFEAYQSTLEKRVEEQESLLLIAFTFLYYQNDEEFNLEEFLREKSFVTQDLNTLIELKIVEKTTYNWVEVYKIQQLVNGEIKETFYMQAEKPHILIFFADYPSTFEFKKETKEEFDEKKYSCLVVE